MASYADGRSKECVLIRIMQSMDRRWENFANTMAADIVAFCVSSSTIMKWCEIVMF